MITTGVYNITVDSSNGYYVSINANATDKTKVTIAEATITNNLYRVTTSNEASTVQHNGSYVAMLTADTGYDLSGAIVNVTMNGVDVTGDVYSDGAINIVNVQGNVIIDAVCPYNSGVVYDGANHGNTEGKWTAIDDSNTATVMGGTWNDGVLSLDGTDDYLTLPLTNAKSVTILLKQTTTNKNQYIFDCRTSANAYLLYSNAVDYMGANANIWVNGTKLASGMNGNSAMPVGNWCEYTIVFNTAFTGNMYVGCRYSANEGYLGADVARICVLDTDITPST